MQTSSVLKFKPATYNRFLKFVAGLGGLLYGIDVGIIAAALPYLEATSGLTAGQISFVVAAVLLGTVISTLFAGVLADGIGRKRLMILSGALFAASIPVIALSHSYELLIVGRLFQGISAGLIGVVVPLYLAECLAPEDRGQGTAMFQWLLTLGIVAAAGIGMYFSFRVEEVAKTGQSADAFYLQRLRLAEHFLGIAAAGIGLCAGRFSRGGIAALAVPARAKETCAGGAVALQGT